MNSNQLTRVLLEDDFDFDLKAEFATGPFGPVSAKLGVEERYSPNPSYTRSQLLALYPPYEIDDVSGFLNGLDSHRLHHLLNAVESSPHPRVQFLVVAQPSVSYKYLTAGMPLKMSQAELMDLLRSRQAPREVVDQFERLNPLKLCPILYIMKSALVKATGGVP